MTNFEPKDIRTGKAPEHRKAALNEDECSFEISDAKIQPSWHGKNRNEMNSTELNKFYRSTMKSTAIKDFDDEIYIHQESVGLPQYNGTTPKMEEFLRKLAKRYILIAETSGYLTKSEEIRHSRNNGLIIKLYIRDTANSNIKRLPSVNKEILHHLNTFSSSLLITIIPSKM